MKKDKDYWCPIYNAFCRRHPELAEDIIDWYPSGQNEIVVKLRGDVRYSFDLYGNLYKLYDSNDNNDDISDEDFKSRFSRKLYDKLCIMNITQDELSYKTGISQTMISKYIRGVSVPSAINLHKICRVLKTSPNELLLDPYEAY